MINPQLFSLKIFLLLHFLSSLSLLQLFLCKLSDIFPQILICYVFFSVFFSCVSVWINYWPIFSYLIFCVCYVQSAVHFIKWILHFWYGIFITNISIWLMFPHICSNSPLVVPIPWCLLFRIYILICSSHSLKKMFW